MTCITTYSGLNFDYLKPVASSICDKDIIQGLSNDCRFAGQLPVFYSVAQHCWLMSQIVPEEFALEALLHDASEAYCRDIPSPLKRLLPDYKVIEHRIDMAIREKIWASCRNVLSRSLLRSDYAGHRTPRAGHR